MNAAAKIVHQSNVFQGQWFDLKWSKLTWLKTVLVVAVLLHALAVIYVTNITRATCSQLEAAEDYAHQLQLQHGQLLLEQASLLNPGRLEMMAKRYLHMTSPTPQHAYLLRSK